MLHAAIGIGSNSTRLLIGNVEQGRVEPLVRMREGTKLFAGMSDGKLSVLSMEKTAMAVAWFAQEARERGCESIRLIATSASRDARNSDFLVELVRASSGLEMEIISGAEEARLSFLGSTGGGYSGMVDIGGGSTELAIGGGEMALMGTSAQLGASRLAAQWPDAGKDLDEILRQARVVLMNHWGRLSHEKLPEVWTAIGGTCTCVASIDLALEEYDREQVDGYVISRDRVAQWTQKLAKMSFEERVQVRGMQPKRADIIVHGCAILQAVMETGKIESVRVSNRSNLDGCLQEIAKNC